MKDVKERGKFLSEEFGMDSHQTRKIWCFGPSTSGPNMLMDVTKSCQNLHEVKDTVVAGFQWATEEVCLTSLQARVDFILIFFDSYGYVLLRVHGLNGNRFIVSELRWLTTI